MSDQNRNTILFLCSSCKTIRKLFLRLARALPIAENVAKARPEVNNCRYRISSILQRNLYIEMKIDFAARGKFMLIICPFELSELCRPVIVSGLQFTYPTT